MYSVFPELLSEKDWVTGFENYWPALWLDWGGLSSIDKNSPLFHKEHTGMINNLSYHRGDSWFWINNLAALCLYRVNKQKFRKYVNKIIKASSEEILWSGTAGHHAEISSASSLSSKGCLSQLWSAALFIELIHEVYKK